MARRRRRPPATQVKALEPVRTRCVGCGGPLGVAYYCRRAVTTLDAVVGLTLQVRHCITPGCRQYHRPYRPEEALGWALPHGECGLDVIALVGTLRFREHRSVPEIHQALRARDLVIAERPVTPLVERYEALVTVHLGNDLHLQDVLAQQDAVVLAIEGLQPDVGHAVLWVLRDTVSGEILLARSLLGGGEAELVGLIGDVQTLLAALPGGPVPIRGVVSDGQRSIRNAVQTALPGVPHQLCQCHSLREAARPIYDADRHAKKARKKLVRGVRPIERVREVQEVQEAQEAQEATATTESPVARRDGDDGQRPPPRPVGEMAQAAAAPAQLPPGAPPGAPVLDTAAIRGDCLAVRSALTDDGRPPLAASGLRLRERLTLIQESIARVREKGGACRPRWPSRPPSTGSSASWTRR